MLKSKIARNHRRIFSRFVVEITHPGFESPLDQDISISVRPGRLFPLLNSPGPSEKLATPPPLVLGKGAAANCPGSKGVEIFCFDRKFHVSAQSPKHVVMIGIFFSLLYRVSFFCPKKSHKYVNYKSMYVRV